VIYIYSDLHYTPCEFYNKNNSSSNNNDDDEDNNNNRSLQNDTKQIKTTIAWNLNERREAKRLHGQFPRSLDKGLTDKEQSY
jgi:hypothetical protein